MALDEGGDEDEDEDEDGVIVDGIGWSWFGLDWTLWKRSVDDLRVEYRTTYARGLS